MSRKIPRPFHIPWGDGQIIEEVSVQAPHWEPTIQLKEYEEGQRSLRFCYHSEGRFGRGPMMIGEEEIAQFGKALARTRWIGRMLRKMAGSD